MRAALVVSRNADEGVAPARSTSSTYTSQPAAPTGTYEAVAYLVKDEKRREVARQHDVPGAGIRAGSHEGAARRLSATPVAGWLRPADVKARITVAHLFGAPAGNRRVEGELSLTPVLPRFTRTRTTASRSAK